MNIVILFEDLEAYDMRNKYINNTLGGPAQVP